MRTPRLLLVIGALFFTAATACSSSSSPATTPSGTDATTVTQAIGPEGGTINVGGAIVTFPKDAVSASMMITISVDTAIPDGYVSLSKIFKCEPSGTNFNAPVEMRMPFVDDGKGAATLFWSSGADPSFKDLGGKVDGNTVVSTVQHFSSGFVGRKK